MANGGHPEPKPETTQPKGAEPREPQPKEKPKG
jgi:hypothetical protein